MLSLLQEQLKTGLEIGTRLIDENVERNIRFATESLNTGLESSKKLRSSKTIGEVVEAQMGYMKDVQTQITSLNTENTAALQELRHSATDFASKIKESIKK